MQHGYRTDAFVLLENQRMATPFAIARATYSDGEYGELDDNALREALATSVREAGGNVGAIDIAPRPNASLPM